MSEVTHTPGPWKVRLGGMDGDIGFVIGSHVTNEVVCERWPCTCDNEDRRRMAMDAKLIAAAPALLEACRYAYTEMDVIPPHIKCQLSDAIRKATQ